MSACAVSHAEQPRDNGLLLNSKPTTEANALRSTAAALGFAGTSLSPVNIRNLRSGKTRQPYARNGAHATSNFRQKANFSTKGRSFNNASGATHRANALSESFTLNTDAKKASTDGLDNQNIGALRVENPSFSTLSAIYDTDKLVQMLLEHIKELLTLVEENMRLKNATCLASYNMLKAVVFHSAQSDPRKAAGKLFIEMTMAGLDAYLKVGKRAKLKNLRHFVKIENKDGNNFEWAANELQTIIANRAAGSPIASRTGSTTEREKLIKKTFLIALAIITDMMFIISNLKENGVLFESIDGLASLCFDIFVCGEFENDTPDERVTRIDNAVLRVGGNLFGAAGMSILKQPFENAVRLFAARGLYGNGLKLERLESE
ncbi:hypothetical protein CYMTET_37342 [Cymbomonas tetramitiformis]|uniref:Uncharacterized protein n=1 Tax=Cymbomonas tetramitiformis TaxID=36881 RepID=A0AAE0F697_9CHLO|nr:hypothetical protein CYMTET_37342 [Cymbomonas tetramitiformis]